jgi:hypothetical protein
VACLAHEGVQYVLARVESDGSGGVQPWHKLRNNRRPMDEISANIHRLILC